MERKYIKSNLMLLTSALIWGIAFVAQSVGMKYVGPFTFNGVRCILGGIVLLPVAVFFWGKEGKNNNRRDLIIGGLLCGILLFVSSSLQQYGLKYTSVGKAGFITTLYIIIVPVIQAFFGKRLEIKTWIAAIIALIGMYLLCITESFSLEKGDIYLFLCAVVFSVHILSIAHYSPKVNGVALSCIQFWISGIISLVLMLSIEHPQIEMVLQVWKPIAYTGILSSGVAYTFQIVAQKHTKAALASLILSMESVIAAFSGWLILHESMTAREVAGSCFVFVAIILAQLNLEPRILFRKIKKQLYFLEENE